MKEKDLGFDWCLRKPGGGDFGFGQPRYEIVRLHKPGETIAPMEGWFGGAVCYVPTWPVPLKGGEFGA